MTVFTWTMSTSDEVTFRPRHACANAQLAVNSEKKCVLPSADSPLAVEGAGSR